ncbi:hypothetical protein APHAL10511_006522 [Amanita phalloides]|nr:hypothetical protein APHAL10511_006522 [Amanita phalloides]
MSSLLVERVTLPYWWCTSPQSTPRTRYSTIQASPDASMAYSERESTATVDLTEQEVIKLSQESDAAGENETQCRASDRALQSTGDGEEGKEAEPLPQEQPAATMNASDQADNPDFHSVPSRSVSTPPVSAVSPTPTRPALVQLNSSQSHSGSPTPTATHPKKFSSININKKFLEKTSSASAASSAMTTTSSTTKSSSNGNSRPPAQASSSHPRLVTTKLTATAPIPSSVAGWSRPSSTAPPAPATSTNSPNGTTPAPSVPATTTSSASALTAPHPNKVIQPGSRSVLHQQVVANTGSNKDAGSGSGSSAGPPGKPAWSNVKSSAARLDVTANDFPTAAEVAQGARKSKPPEQPSKEAPVAPAIATSKSSRNEEADTFRGVHLDPNAHHWDEMVEDDDNYWDNVIEFDDGRQYKVDVVEQTSRSREPSPPGSVKSFQSTKVESATEVFVSKEERFADDFDRSWPSGPGRGSTVCSQQRSPQEPPRVLFNERSNKMEPYSSHRVGHGAFPSKRGGLQDRMISPTEPRSASSAFSRPSGGSTDFGPGRSRRFSNASNSSFVLSSDRQRDKDKRDGPLSPHVHKGDGLPGRPPSLRGRERDSDKGRDLDHGRHTAMGPPPVPTHAWRSTSRESVRHRLSISGSTNGRRYPQDEQSDHQGPSSSVRGPPHSPALSQASVSTRAMLSPATPSLLLPSLGGHDLEELKKDVMQSAAARAKQRRQQEEEAREAQKERARRKAVELEAKMKAEEAERTKKQQEQLGLPEQDDESKKPEEEEEVDGTREEMDSANFLHQPPPLPATGPSNIALSASETAETWRRTAPLLPKSDEPRFLQSRPSSNVAFMPPPPPTPLDHIQTLADGKQEDLEVVDFTDMGRLVGETSPALSSAEQPKKTSRPVASDFFDDVPSSLPLLSLSPSIKNEIETWRKKTPLNQIPTSEQQTKGLTNKDRPEGISVVDSLTAAEQMHKANEGPSDIRYPAQVSPQSQRTPRTQNFYHQAPMSSLVDAMSRIKGAIHDMKHAEELSRESNPMDAEVSVPQAQLAQNITIKQNERWVPPSLRSRTIEFQQENQEEFYRTAVEPPQSSEPVWGNLPVRLPSESIEREPVHRRQMHLFSKTVTVRWDILSFEPPVEGMTKRNLSVSDVLFRPPYGVPKGKTKYRVHLPRSRGNGPRVQGTGPNPSRTNSFGAFGKQNGADASISWRKPSSPLSPRPSSSDETMAEVNATSRSPLPEAESSSAVVGISLRTESYPVDSSTTLLRIRSQPKMPEGSSVAFYRGSRIDVPGADSKTLVNFIVSSEIDDPPSPQSHVPKEELAAGYSTTSETIETIVIEHVPDAYVPKSDASEVKEASPPTGPETIPLSDARDPEKPSRQPSPWSTSRGVPVKESPARPPDPEHLKAVWSQTSNKAGLRTVNSLEGIADDLTSLPFTLQDVKSEDGETPPPAQSASSSRMSLHDVTRAFQQVPSSSVSAPHKPSISPPSTTAPVARPTPSNYSYPMPPTMRPTYAAYPSPMMSHSPSPTMMYPHMVSSPVPTRMQANGHAPIYNHVPMWVPVQHSTQNANNIMRPPMASPYAPAMYAHPMPANMPGTPQSQNMQVNRNRNMPVMSPVLQHAGAHMYPGSPAMMHMQMTPTSGYIPLPAGRGQPRPENGQMGMQPTVSTHPSSSQIGFIPPSPYMRNW